MTTFENGPAAGQALTLSRAPKFLRVVEQDGKWDALDLLDDEPKPAEKLFAYQLHGEAGVVFIDGSDSRGRRRGWSCIFAKYRIVKDQPSDMQMRSNTAWREWCISQDPRKLCS